MKKISFKFLFFAFISLSMFGCATTGNSFYPFESAEAKQTFKANEKTYVLKELIIKDEKSNKPEEKGFMNNENLKKYFYDNISKKLEDKNLTSSNPNFDLVVKLDIYRVLNFFNSKSLTNVSCEIKVYVKKDGKDIVIKNFSGQTYSSLKAVFGFSNLEQESKYYPLITNTVINLILGLQ